MYRLLLFCALLLTACGTKKVVQEERKEPSPTGFWYYDPEFRLDQQNSPLQTDGLYFRIHEVDAFGDIYRMFRFAENGQVIAYVVYNTPDKIAEQVSVAEGNIHGYYTTRNDSIFFTTKVYYDHNPIFYEGRVYPDSIVLSSRNYKTKATSKGAYYFYEQ